MILKSMSLELMVEQLRAKHPTAFVVHTPENSDQVVIRVYFRGAKFARKAQDERRLVEIVTKEILPTTIRGVPGIRSAEVREIKRHHVAADNSMSLKTVYAIETVGTNIYGVLFNNRIDPLRVVSSSLGDTQKIFGVSAARQKIISEIRRFMGSKAPNPHHLLLYADEMSRTGSLTSLEKGGMNVREKDNCLLRMAMSAPTAVVQEAAPAGATNKLYGVAPYMLLGRAPPLGTGWNEFTVDPEFVGRLGLCGRAAPPRPGPLPAARTETAPWRTRGRTRLR
jgi:hypothetical protein